MPVSYNDSSSFIAIVGTKDNTQILIKSPVDTTKTRAGVPHKIILNKLETYLVVGKNFSDLTGTEIQAEAPIAVVGGAMCAYVPVNVPACDHLVEMMPSVESWGNLFLTYPLALRTKGDLIRILSSVDNTEVKINGSLVAILKRGGFYDVILGTSSLIETSRPALVSQYSLGQNYDGVVSDPFMMLVTPIEQFRDKYTFAAPLSGFSSHFANVVIRTTSLSSIRVDGVAPNLSIFKPIGDGSFSGGQIPIAPGSHSIAAESPFGLNVYGFGDYESYGYPGGMAAEIINPIYGDYKNVRVTSQLVTGNVDLDFSSFVVAPEKIEHSDGTTVIEWFFPAFSIGQIKNLDYEVVAKNLLPGEKRVITNSLDLSYQDLNGVEHNRHLGQQELTVLSSGFTIGVSTDKQGYSANQEVNISTQVANAGSVNGLVSVTLEVRDAQGNYVAGLNSPPAFVLGARNSIALSPQIFSTGTTYSGNYQIHAILKNQDGAVVAEDSALFSIVDADVEQMSAQVTTDKLVYNRRDVLAIEDKLTSLSQNQLIQDVTVITRVLHEDGEVFWHASNDLAQLTPQEFESFAHAVPLTNAKLGNYTVQLKALNTDGLTLASDEASFQIQDNPLFALRGGVTVDKDELPLGESQSCTYTINNTGIQPINGQLIKLNLVRVDEESNLFSTEQSVDLVSQGEKSFAPDLPIPAAQGNFACVLEAVVSGQATVLATALFTVKESPIKLAGDFTLGEKARLLVLIDSSTAERTYLENLLTNTGWFYTIVDNAAAFKTELTQGGYGVYALLSEKVTLDQTTQNLLNAKVAAGDGLFVAGATDRRHQTLEQALGIKARANEAYAKGVAVQESALGYAWERAFNKSSRVLNFSANGANVIGEYRKNLAGTDTQTVLGALGAAGRYGNFVWDNFTSLSSTVEGRIAVGGNLSLQNFSVGDKLDPNKLHDVVTVGGNVTFPSGRIYYGNLIAGGSVSGVGDPVRFGMAQGAVIRGSSALDVNFTGEREYLQELSTKLATLPANGTVKMQWGGMELKGDCTSTSQVFNVNGVDLGVAHTFAVSCIPAGATVVFNVSGTNVTIKSMGMQSLTTLRDNVLFNFPQATSLKMTSVGIEGSILAPFAQVDQPAGRIDGQVIVKSWYSTTTGYMSIHNRFFSGDLSAAVSPASKNALATYQYQKGKSVFAGFDVLAQAVALGVSSDNPFAQLLLSALEQVNPAPITARAGKVVPVVLTYENTGAQTATGQVRLALTGNIALLNSAAFTQVANSSDWVLPLSLDAGASNSQTIYVQLPVSGASSITLQLQTGVTPDWETRFEKALNLNVQ
ncbi:choice-of-anchor A domain-containing protein [Cellvibrio fibrivorans]|uniref:Choice-of-anchor A domain-containing protein n=2 Tax=Cellvibrio fibrivorans TaxID=126350 RepID=A0ABU1UU25_9GAMM|nr:choice-of-anchor A domain-containing protein [Cellvibrio fibrivorans]